MRILLPVALLAAGACVATRKDVERIELTLRAMQDTSRVQQTRSDSLTRTLVRESMQVLATQFTREFDQVSDSVRQVALSLQKLQGDVSLSMYELRSQLSTLQEGLGQTQRRLNDVRTSVEAAAAAPALRPPPDPQASVGQPAADAAPPAAQLMQMGDRQLLTKATGSARMNFQTLIDQYPTHDFVPRAQAQIAASYAAEGNKTAADSVYALVVQKYPTSEVAANALYKRASLARDARNAARAIALFQQLVETYPKSDEGRVAVDELQKLRKP